MKFLQGKKIKIKTVDGKESYGLVTGATENLIKILNNNDTDQQVFFTNNIISYKIYGQGISGGRSGLYIFACKNMNINCKGKLLVSTNKSSTICDMKCKVCKSKTIIGEGFKCDFGTLGEMQMMPSKLQRVLFDGLIKENNKVKKDE